jgi:predicted ATPase
LDSLASAHGFQNFRVQAAFFRKWGLSLQGYGEQSISQMHNELKSYHESGTQSNFSYFHALLAQAYGKIGDCERGIRLLTASLTNGQKTGERHHAAETLRLKGQFLLELSSDNATEAETCFHQAISIAQNQSAKSWELRAATSLARLWQPQGKREEARELLEPVYSWFTEGFDTADLIDAKMLDELS